MLINYALSLWIANLGVVPLFSFAFFLAFPAFLAFNFLLVRVCIVLEPIKISLSYRINIYNRRKFLSFVLYLVKIFIVIDAPQNSWAIETLFLAKGEQTEIEVKSLKSFSVGNPEVIKYKYRSKSTSLLVKAKTVGFSDIAVWDNKDTKKTFHIYVTSKKEQLKKMQLIKSLKESNLDIDVNGDIVILNGKIDTLQDYFLIKSLQKQKLKSVIFNLKLTKHVRNTIIANTYKYFNQNGANSIKCVSSGINIICEFLSTRKKINYSNFNDKYGIIFHKKENHLTFKSFEFKFHVVSIESSKGYNHSSGFDAIDAELSELIKFNRLNLSSKNIYINGNDIHTKLVSAPEVIALIDKPFELSVGSEVPFNIGVDVNQRTEWRFAGLKLKGRAYLLNGKLALEVSTQFTSTSNQAITGPKSKTNIYLDDTRVNKIFSIILDTQSSNQSHIPYLSKIPILKSLFMTNESEHRYKKINCYVEIQEVI